MMRLFEQWRAITKEKCAAIIVLVMPRLDTRQNRDLTGMLVANYESGLTAKAICAEYGIARSTLFLWKQQYTADETGQIPREQYLLGKELERLRTENKILKPVAAHRHLRYPSA